MRPIEGTKIIFQMKKDNISIPIQWCCSDLDQSRSSYYGGLKSLAFRERNESKIWAKIINICFENKIENENKRYINNLVSGFIGISKSQFQH